MRVVNAEVKRGKSAHRKPDDMRLVDLELVEHVYRVIDRAPLRIFLDRIRNLRWRIAARIVGDAAVAAGEIADLKLPGAIVAGEFMDEQDRPAGAAVLVV